ncbi:MAG: hypothetical protein LBB98_00895 [Treponema sp.]|jgi:putative pyruvate formate lyase activating enzyme|nr:hypothetical protein [Treponema sp.]
MTQYTPVGGDQNIPRRYVNRDEYDRLLQWLTDMDIEDGFCQELVCDDSWLPDFERINPFSSELSVPVWHWKTGLLT